MFQTVFNTISLFLCEIILQVLVKLLSVLVKILLKLFRTLRRSEDSKKLPTPWRVCRFKVCDKHLLQCASNKNPIYTVYCAWKNIHLKPLYFDITREYDDDKVEESLFSWCTLKKSYSTTSYRTGSLLWLVICS